MNTESPVDLISLDSALELMGLEVTAENRAKLRRWHDSGDFPEIYEYTRETQAVSRSRLIAWIAKKARRAGGE